MKTYSLLFSFLPAAFLLCAVPVRAHGGHDLLLLETEDVGEARVMNAYTGTDTVMDNGERSTEVTTGLSYAPNERLLISPHFHVGSRTMSGFRYTGAAVGLRYRTGTLPGGRWATAVSLEVERPTAHHDAAPPEGTGGEPQTIGAPPTRGARRHGDQAHIEEPGAHTEGTLRLVLSGDVGNTMLVGNFVAGRQFARGGEHTWALGLGAVRMRRNGDNVALEMLARLPASEGVEILPSYHRQMDKLGLLFGFGLFTSRATTCGTLHALAIGEF